MKKYKTQFPALSYCLAAPNHWRIIDNSTGGAIGPIYGTETELLSDLLKFANERANEIIFDLCEEIDASRKRQDELSSRIKGFISR